jgi:drug/metabolite transporter (DMT)-like permease
VNWLGFTFISVLSRAIYGVLTKVLSNKVKVSVYTQAILLPLSGAIIALVASPFLGGINLDFSKISLVALTLVVLGQGLGNITYFAAIKNLTSSTAQITFSSILVFNTLLSLIFLGLTLTPLNVLGIFFLMLAIMSVTTGKVELHHKGALTMVLSALMFAIFQLSSSELSKQIGAATYLIIAYLGAALVVFIVKHKTVINDLKNIKNTKTTFGVPLLTAIPSIGNFLFAYYAYRYAPEPSKVAILLTSQVVFAVIISYFVLHERSHALRKVVAALLVLMSAFLIKG